MLYRSAERGRLDAGSDVSLKTGGSDATLHACQWRNGDMEARNRLTISILRWYARRQWFACPVYFFRIGDAKTCRTHKPGNAPQ